jgi:geranylgeranyl diphosphate synthase, type I
MSVYTPTLDDLRAAVDSAIAGFLDERRRALPEAAPMLTEIERLLAAGGKRLRPSFCYWAYRAAGGVHRDEAVRAAAGLELLHTFAIVHDDIMDGSAERRGQPAVHVRHGTGIALLVGDLALVLADALLLGAGFSADTMMRAFVPYSEMRQEVIAGQQLDVLAAGRVDISRDEARRIAVLKSGRYSIEKPLAIGAALAGASCELADGLRRVGEPLGEAFQLRDDVLGTFGDPAETGKPADGDIREGKRHVLYAEAAARAVGSEREFLLARWGAGDDLTQGEVERLRSIIETCGARRATEDLLDARAADARRALGSLAVDAESAAALTALARHATDRRL